jgi:hypothetical protein
MTRTVYIASKSRHGAQWKELRAGGEPIVSTWIDECEAGQTSDWDDLWSRCIREAAECDTLILYAEPGEVLYGAMIEVGAALASGRRVIYVGPDDVVRTILRTSRIERAESVTAALRAAEGQRET